MKVIRRRVGFAAGCVAVAVVVVTACGESDNTAPTGGGPSGQQTVSTSAGPNPNSPENSPAGDLPDNQACVPFTPPRLPPSYAARFLVPGSGWEPVPIGRAGPVPTSPARPR